MDELRDRPEYNLIEYDDYWVIPLKGRIVSTLKIGYELRLQFVEPVGEEIEIWMGSETYLKVNGIEYKLSAEEPRALGPLLGVVRNIVRSAKAHKDGHLEIGFQDGMKLLVRPLPEVESWGVAGSRWLRVVCMPGGDLAVWKPDSK